MALKKRGKTWHCHFVVNGATIPAVTWTTDWREAQAKEKELIAQASEGKLSHTSTSLARQPFGLAADDYVAARKLGACTCQPSQREATARAAPGLLQA
jgi:hypothetical protein